MELESLIVIGASLLFACLVFIPAEMQIYRSRSAEDNRYYAKRDHQWSQKSLNRLLTFGLSLLTFYIILSDPRIMDALEKIFSLK